MNSSLLVRRSVRRAPGAPSAVHVRARVYANALGKRKDGSRDPSLRQRTTKPSRGLKRLPSARTALSQMAAGRPSFIGRPVIVIFVPTGSSLGRIPARCSVLGPSASNPHVVTLPSLPVTSTSSHEWGLVYWNSFTTPSTVIVFFSSNIVAEWWARATPAEPPSTAAAIAAATNTLHACSFTSCLPACCPAP